MGFLETSFKMDKVSPAVSGLTKQAAIEKLQDPAFFIKCDPNMVSFDAGPDTPWDSYDLPKDVKPLAQRVKFYNVKDKYENPIMGSDIDSTYEFVDIADGFWTRTKSPMGTVIESFFTVREKGNGELEVVQACECKCNRALVTFVKKDLDKNYTLVHDLIAQRLAGN